MHSRFFFLLSFVVLLQFVPDLHLREVRQDEGLCLSMCNWIYSGG